VPKGSGLVAFGSSQMRTGMRDFDKYFRPECPRYLSIVTSAGIFYFNSKKHAEEFNTPSHQ
jgi:hypothetical protein